MNKNVIFIKGLACSILFILISLSCSSSDNTEDVIEDPSSSPEENIEQVTLSIQDILNIDTFTATVHAAVTDDGNSNVSERGVYVSVNPDPIDDKKYLASSIKASGEFTVSVSGLIENTTYYIVAYAENKAGIGYSEVLSFTTKATIKPIVYINSESFNSEDNFNESWNMFYPWGSDHNGSARMFEDNVLLKKNGILEIVSEWTNWYWEGYSTADPHLRITFHSGAIHAKEKIRVTEELPYWEISGDFMAPTAPSSWPAFWISGSDSWPPEVDILEFKGSDVNWQNTVTGPAWNQTVWSTQKTTIPDAATSWHNYKLALERIDAKDVLVRMFIDNDLKHEIVKDYTNKPFWLIINMQMEGASGTTNDESLVRSENQVFKARNIKLSATPNKN